MSKQSDRKKNKLAKIKVANNLLNAQKNSKNQRTKSNSETENGDVKPDAKRWYERPGLLGIVGTVLLTIACFIQLYGHIWAIWTLFVSLFIYIQALRIELAEQKKSLTHSRYVGIFGIIIALVLCIVLTVIDFKNKVADSKTNPPVEPTQNADSTDFSIIHKTIIFSPSDKPAFWLVNTNSSGKLVRSPVPVLMWIQFENLKSIPFRIDAYTIDSQLSNGRWKSNRTIDARNGELFSALGDPHKALGIDCKKTGFNSLIESRDIAPNESVGGWIYFDCGNVQAKNYRLRIKGADGEEISKQFEAQAINYDVQINKPTFDQEHTALLFTFKTMDITIIPESSIQEGG